MVEQDSDDVIGWPGGDISTSPENQDLPQNLDLEIQENIEIVPTVPSIAAEQNEVYHFGSINQLKAFINQNIPGLIATSSKAALHESDRNLVAKEIIEHILDTFPSVT